MKLGEQVSVYGTIARVQHYTTPKKLTIFSVYLKDSTGILPINFFVKNIKSGMDCCKENGVIHTLKLVIGKIKERFKLKF